MGEQDRKCAELHIPVRQKWTWDRNAKERFIQLQGSRSPEKYGMGVHMIEKMRMKEQSDRKRIAIKSAFRIGDAFLESDISSPLLITTSPGNAIPIIANFFNASTLVMIDNENDSSIRVPGDDLPPSTRHPVQVPIQGPILFCSERKTKRDAAIRYSCSKS